MTDLPPEDPSGAGQARARDDDPAAARPPGGGATDSGDAVVATTTGSPSAVPAPPEPPDAPTAAPPTPPLEPASAVAPPPPVPPPAPPAPDASAASAPPPPLPPTAPPPAPPVAPHAAPEPAPGPSARRWQAPVAALVVVAVVLAAFFLGRSSDDGTEVATPTTTAAPAVPAGFVTFTDPEGGFTLQHPKEWERLNPPRDKPEFAGSRLLLSAGQGHYLHVQVLLSDPSTAKSEIEQNLKDVNVLAQQDITLNGLPGYSYLYTFVDKASGQEAKHAHYVVLRGRKAYTLVFQAMPSAEFERLAPTFAKVIGSFQSTSEDLPPGAGAPATTAPAATTVTTGR